MIKNKKLYTILILQAFLLNASCHVKDAEIASSKTDGLRAVTEPAADPKWDAIAAFLAGISLPENHVYSHLVQTDEYRKHQDFMNGLWNKIEKTSIIPIKTWHQKTPKAYPGVPVFYPLSGADFINMYLMYPDAKEYTMAAMEETGSIHISDNPAEALRNLASVRGSVHMYASQNYFQTKIMSEKFRENQNIRGVLPVLLVFMKRMGLTISRIAMMPALAETGKPAGVVIYFTEDQAGELKTLRYFEKKLTNSFQPSEFGLYQYRLIMKSAVYLLQMKNYRQLADTIEKGAVMVIQDDSGLPYGYFKNGDWIVKLYGSYHRMHVKGTEYIYQKDLKEDLDRSDEVLPFQFGYGTLAGKDKSNLMIAIRRT